MAYKGQVNQEVIVRIHTAVVIKIPIPVSRQALIKPIINFEIIIRIDNAIQVSIAVVTCYFPFAKRTCKQNSAISAQIIADVQYLESQQNQ